MGARTFKHWDAHLAKATWLANIRGSINWAGPAKLQLPPAAEKDKVPIVHVNMSGQTVWVSPTSGKGKPIHRITFTQGPGCTWWVTQKDGEVRSVPQGDLILGENSQWIKLYDVNCYIILSLYVITAVVIICYMNGITVQITQTKEEWTLMKPSKVRRWWNQNSLEHATVQHSTPSSCCTQCHPPVALHRSPVMLCWLRGLRTTSSCPERLLWQMEPKVMN